MCNIHKWGEMRPFRFLNDMHEDHEHRQRPVNAIPNEWRILCFENVSMIWCLYTYYPQVVDSVGMRTEGISTEDFRGLPSPASLS